MQQSYIASELCVSKDDKMNACKGNCYLQAHLEKQDQKSASAMSFLKEKVKLYFITLEFLIANYCIQTTIFHSDHFSVALLERCNEIFHPPA